MDRNSIKLALEKVKRYRITKNIIHDEEQDSVIVESPLTIQIDQVGGFTLLCSPINLKELAIGFAYTEGFIDNIDELIEILETEQPIKTIGLKIEDPSKSIGKRNLVISSACGFCGKKNIENLLSTIPPCKKTLFLPIHLIKSLSEKVRERQELFRKTGGTHAAAIFNQKGEILALSEDIGRHHAMDKTIGYCLLNQINMKNCGIFLTSRLSFEMVAKAARAGLELMIAVSSPTSLAISAASHWNITLCGFMRENAGNIYTEPDRLII